MDTTVQMHTDIYKRALPFVDEAIEAYAAGGQLTDQALTAMVNHIITRADFRRRPVSGCSERSLNDLVRGLLLSRVIFGNCGRREGRGCGDYYDYYYPYYYPYYSYYPFWGESFGGRGGGHGHRGIGRGGHGGHIGGGRGAGHGHGGRR